ncbi:hypothetical protein [Pseudomonas juntendi]|uniref:Uncharacterized protein n=1 Tax=Pseudomonas juntendi TaxID=2666183 RepID=A0A7W2JHF1_9PSED|nr:hypothetical protein [Pseudomonas juntendi]MBA6058932.1 hypothetical protein [Pseudomonas juntendi]MBA6126090.1 hypothetical protein [Pseudomonas juntendi]
MTKVHRYKVVQMLSEAGGWIGYDSHGPEVVMASAYDDLKTENEALRKDAERYQWLRSRDLNTISQGGVFAGITPQNMVINEETLDEAVDDAIAKEAQP